MSEVEIRERLVALEVFSKTLGDHMKDDKEAFTVVHNKLDTIIEKLDDRLDKVENVQGRHSVYIKIIIGVLTASGVFGAVTIPGLSAKDNKAAEVRVVSDNEASATEDKHAFTMEETEELLEAFREDLE